MGYFLSMSRLIPPLLFLSVILVASQRLNPNSKGLKRLELSEEVGLQDGMGPPALKKRMVIFVIQYAEQRFVVQIVESAGIKCVRGGSEVGYLGEREGLSLI